MQNTIEEKKHGGDSLHPVVQRITCESSCQSAAKIAAEFAGSALAILIAMDDQHIKNLKICCEADDARGCSADSIIWLREPTQAERAVVLPVLFGRETPLNVPGEPRRAE